MPSKCSLLMEFLSRVTQTFFGNVSFPLVCHIYMTTCLLSGLLCFISLELSTLLVMFNYTFEVFMQIPLDFFLLLVSREP